MNAFLHAILRLFHRRNVRRPSRIANYLADYNRPPTYKTGNR